MKTLLALSVLPLLSLSAAEVLSGEYRAVTIEVGSRKQFRVPKLETVTGASGRCLEEGMDIEENESIWIEASCSGVRTSLVWKSDGTRIHVMACGEEVEGRDPTLFKLRQKLQGELKAHKSVTACVKNGRIELWGWVKGETDAAQVKALEKKYSPVRSFVEMMEL